MNETELINAVSAILPGEWAVADVSYDRHQIQTIHESGIRVSTERPGCCAICGASSPTRTADTKFCAYPDIGVDTPGFGDGPLSALRALRKRIERQAQLLPVLAEID